MASAAQRLWRRLEELGRVSDEEGRLTRTFLSPAMRRANRLVGEWMKSAGLQVREDGTGNLIGRLESKMEGTPTLLLGSHLDTVRDAGRFDGPLGVLLPIAAIEEVRRRKIELPFSVEVIGFSEEEGVRFSSAYLGSKGYTGQLRAADLNLRDADGISVREAIARRSPAREHRDPYLRSNGESLRSRAGLQKLLGYVEVHIEQGPVLESRNLAVGVVSAIASQTRGRLTFRGQAGHAGTTPMKLRRDALAGAAEFVTRVESTARRTAGLVATVGTLSVSPGAGNVIPGEVVLSLDVRHPRDPVRRRAWHDLLAIAKTIARQRKLGLAWEITQDNGAVACSPALTAQLAASVRAVQGKSISLASGAGHDGVVMSAVTTIAMLFVRCRKGLSHHPEEYASPRDVGVALAVIIDMLQRLAKA